MYRLILAAAALLASSAAQAHVGVGDTSGFAHGFAHPMGGIDHILAMVAVGLFAAHLGGRALYLVPLSFVAMMIVGGVLGVMGVSLPFVEVGIGLSVVVF
jgi:urease accessory protein